MGIPCCKKSPEPITKKDPPRIIIKTQTNTHQILHAEATPQNTQLGFLKYICPLCSLFFSHIFVTTCCMFYICHRCAQDMQNNHRLKPACPQCWTEPLHLQDVDPSAPIRRFTDSADQTVQVHQTSQFANSQRNRWVPILEAVSQQDNFSASVKIENLSANLNPMYGTV